MRTISLKIDAATARRLESHARREGTSKSALVRAALARFLDDRAASDSILARAGDLAGCFAGPPDLASASEHLDGYGA